MRKDTPCAYLLGTAQPSATIRGMDIDFTYLLTMATLVAFAIWLGDILYRRVASRLGRAVSETRNVVVEYSRSLLPVLALIVLVRGFLYEPYQIPSGSMIPTLEVGDFVLVNKHAYGVRLPVLGTKVFEVDAPARGDVMVFVPPHDDRYFIKRVIGLPGDRVVYVNKSLYLNGERISQRLVDSQDGIQAFEESLGEDAHRIHAAGNRAPRARREWTVPTGHYFVMGDNRDFSQDSRAWGFVKEDKVVGKAIAIWAHKAAGWNLPTFARNRFI